MQTSKHHHNLTNGVGKCSVPMWSGGCPAGFCDADAYGPQTKEYRASFPIHPRDWEPIPAYAPGLACPGHGGPSAPSPETPPAPAPEKEPM